MNKKIWTAISKPISGGMVVLAQCKSSKAELIKRIRRDDDLWFSKETRYELRKKFKNKKFRKGIAFVAVDC